MNFFESELKKIVGNSDILKDQRYVGRMCYGSLGGDLRARVEFVTLGVNPHIWTDSGKSDWYVFRPGAAEYQKVADTLENYMSIFQDMAMTQESQDCTMQMGT